MTGAFAYRTPSLLHQRARLGAHHTLQRATAHAPARRSMSTHDGKPPLAPAPGPAAGGVVPAGAASSMVDLRRQTLVVAQPAPTPPAPPAPKRKRRQYGSEEERRMARILKNRRTAEESRQRRLKRLKDLEEVERTAGAREAKLIAQIAELQNTVAAQAQHIEVLRRQVSALEALRDKN